MHVVLLMFYKLFNTYNISLLAGYFQHIDLGNKRMGVDAYFIAGILHVFRGVNNPSLHICDLNVYTTG